MKKHNLLFAFVLCAAYGCSWSPREATSEFGAKPAKSTEISREIWRDPVETFQAHLDSVVSLFEFGDLAEFAEARDSLRFDLEAHLTSFPASANDSQLLQLLTELDKLDSLAIATEYKHLYLAEIDSMALSILNWPEESRAYADSLTHSLHDTLFPRIENKRIDFWIRYYTGPGRARFARTLYRMERYRPIIENILDELGLPKPLLCIPLIESGFNMKARSSAKAVGPWQFIAGTGRIYGLRVNWWLDERRDLVASSYAAGNYLRDLYSLWNNWYLALAAYNAGEYRVARAIVRQKTEDFWKLKLPKQTQRYIPKFLAALYLVRNPEEYGFKVPEVEPLECDFVTIKDATDLKLIARLCDSNVSVIKELNPAILRWCTPPRTEVLVKVPKGRGELCYKRLSEIPSEKRVTWRRHRIRGGETLSQIARKYGTTIVTLKRLNGIKNSHLIRAGRTLIVPMKGGYVELASTKPEYKNRHRKISRKALESYAARGAPPSGYKMIIYTVKDHDTLGEIAENFHTRARKLRSWNNLSYRSYIYPGQKLKIYVPEKFKVPKAASLTSSKPAASGGFIKRNYVVKRGDTMYGISKKFNVRVSDLLVWNNKSRKAKIYPGERMEIWIKSR